MKRRIFVATSLTPDERESAFGLLRDKFNFASKPEEAEFIVFDLSHPPDDWVEFIPTRSRRSIRVVPDDKVPCLLVRCGSKHSDVKLILRLIRRGGIEPRVLTNVEQLRDELLWLEWALPLVRMTPAENEYQDAIVRAVTDQLATLSVIAARSEKP